MPKVAIKVGVALVALAGLGFLFMRSVTSTRAEPYTVQPAHLRNWTLALDSAAGPREPLLVLQPPAGLVNDLFNQVFKRAMESMNPPAAAGIPLVLRAAYERAFAGCLAHRRISDPGANQQLYFVVFDLPEYARFRQQVAALLGGGARADFEPEAQSPVLFIAAAESTFQRWLPLRANPQADCVAPIVAGPAR